MTVEEELIELQTRLAAVEALLPGTDEEFPIFPSQLRAALGAELGDYLLIPRADIAVSKLGCIHGPKCLMCLAIVEPEPTKAPRIPRSQVRTRTVGALQETQEED